MQEIGGYIEFEHFRGKEYHEGAIRLNCGRNALAYLIEAFEIRSIYLPAFICSSVIDLCKKYSVTMSLYSIDESFCPIVPQDFSDSDWLYVVNYYGQINHRLINTLKKKTERLIVDNAQDFFQKPVEGVSTLYTCRKFFGVSDGAYLYSDKILTRELKRDESFNRMGFLLGRFERSASEFYKEYCENNEYFASEPILQMSLLTQNCMKAVDYEFICNKRTENFSFLHSQLQRTNKLKLETPIGAFAYPLYVKDGSRIRKELTKDKIYIPTLWPNVLEECPENSIEYEYAINILPLPVDQRYGLEQMAWMAEKVRLCIG